MNYKIGYGKINSFKLRDKAILFMNQLTGIINKLTVYSAILFILILVYDIGFYQNSPVLKLIDSTYNLILAVVLVFKIISGSFNSRIKEKAIRLFEYLIIAAGITILLANYESNLLRKIFHNDFILFLTGKPSQVGVLLLLYILDIPRFTEFINKLHFNAAQLFALSFLFLILMGTGFLLLPRCTMNGISFLNALFTSVSAVCVTGLTVIDFAGDFTPVGQMAVLLLIQLGGLGVMTFTSFFIYIFQGGSSIRDRIMLKDFLASGEIGNILKILMKILVITFLTEFVGTFCILLFNNGMEFTSNRQEFFFAFFHSVSAFCNAGFSTIRDGLYNSSLQNNIPLHLVIALLIIMGGIGFPVLLNFYIYLKNKIILLINRIRRKPVMYVPRLINVSSRIALITTVTLIVTGTLIYLILERDYTLKDLPFWQKISTSFFGSVTPRTAGFNVVDMARLSYPAVLVTIVLMWIGASPGGTGGGIKTSSFAIALISLWNIARGKENIEIGYREISTEATIRCFVIILISMILIGLGLFIIVIAEPGKNPVQLLFECVSAYSTVGLSITGTPNLTSTSKITLIVLMYTGRVGPLVLLTGIFKQVAYKYHRYPVEQIIIN